MSVIPIMIARGETNKLSRKAMMVLELKSILEKNGLESQMTDGGDLSFEIKGNTYLLEVAEDNDILYYVRLSRFHKYNSEVTRDVIDLFNKEINYKTVKVLSAKTGYYLRTEFLLRDSQYFKVVYSRLIDFIDNANKAILVKCPELKKSIVDNTLTIVNLKLLTEETDSSIIIYPVVTFHASTSNTSKYPVFLRLYRNNVLVRDKVSPSDYSSVEILHSNNQNQPFMMKGWAASPVDTVSYRCELWYNENCIATSSYNKK